MRHLGTRSIEEELESLHESQARDPERVKQLAAVRFYLQTAVYHCTEQWLQKARGITNYLSLLDDIRHHGYEDVTLVTFNYDTLLEDAISRLAGRSPDNHDDYLQLDRFDLFKVHGSVDWGRVVMGHNTAAVNDVDAITRSLIQDAGSIKVSDRYCLQRGEHAPIVRDRANGLVLLPAIAVPVQTKQSFECPPSHMAALLKRLPQITHILIMATRAAAGTRAAPATRATRGSIPRCS